MLLDARDVHKTYPGENGGVAVLSGVSLQLAAGETLALTGESGSGKSTFLHLLGALDQADSGTIDIGGTALNGLDDAGRAALRRDHIGLVFQQFNLIPSLDVAANIAFQARIAGRYDPEWAADVANRLGLSAVLDRYPESLSGGQQQRVAIARALAGRPSLILADEPTGNL
ncbi:MAG: putative ABC transport system ATP-binding protein, partial [Paracoccaceae bacterium]